MDYDSLISVSTLRVLLLVVLFAPLAFAAVLALVGDRTGPARRLACLFAAGHLLLTLYLTVLAAFYLSGLKEGHGPDGFHPIGVPGDTSANDGTPGGGQSHHTGWNLFVVGKADASPPQAVQFFIGLDGLNVWLVPLTSLMTYVAVMLSWHSAKHKAGGYYAWVFVLQSAVTGAFVSFDVLLFYVFFELTLVPTFFLIGGWGVGGGKRDAARKFFLYTLLGSLFSLVGLIGIVYTNTGIPRASATVVDPKVPLARGPVSFDVSRLMYNVQLRQNVLLDRCTYANLAVETKEKELEDKRKQNAADLTPFAAAVKEAREVAATAVADRDAHNATQTWLFFALIAGFVVKVPLVPFHTWLPGAYSEAPAPVTLLLSSLLAKLGVLGMLRIAIPLCADSAVRYGLPVFGTLGAIGVVYAAFCAFTQKDIKLMAAYSSVSHLGLLVLGMFALNGEGLSGAVLHMVNHGLSAGAMFALVAFLYDRYRTTDMTQLGGLWAKHPRWAFFLIVVSLAAVGLPGLNNFVTEMLLIGGLFKPWAVATTGYWLPVAACSGILLSAWYTFTMLKRVLFGPLKEPATVPDGVATGDLNLREGWALFLPAVLCLVLGIFPQLFLNVSKQDVGVIEMKVQQARERVNKPLADAETPPEPEAGITPGFTPPPLIQGAPVPGGGRPGVGVPGGNRPGGGGGPPR